MKKTLTLNFLKIGFVVLIVQFFQGPAYSYSWGDRWDYGKCNICGKYYKHVGIDIGAKAGKKVYFKDHLYYVTKGKDSKNIWKEYIVVRNANNTFTYVVWHLSRIPTFSSGQDLYGKFIGYVADLPSNYVDHIHVGFRKAPFHSSLSIKGALPDCGHKPSGLPKFPEYFDVPYTWRVEIR